MQPNIFSLGAWCRPAWQLRRHFETETAFPFDWQITSFAALMHMLQPEFNFRDELNIEDCVINRFGTVTDTRSGLIFQHDLPAGLVSGFTGSVFMGDDADTLKLLDSVRSKSAFLFDRFKAACQAGPSVFVRWLRGGHPDWEWPEAFDGERPHQLHRQLTAFCGHSDVRTVYVVSTVTDDPAAEGGCDLRRTSYGANAHLLEASRFFRPEAWTGDDGAWTALYSALQDGWLGLGDSRAADIVTRD